MSKKKKNKKNKKEQKSILLLSEIDTSINGAYDSLIEEIQEMQLRINIADAKAMEKQRKKMIRADMGVIPYYVSKDKVKAREKALKEMEKTNFLGRIEDTLKKLVPCVILIA
jgi:beta-glucosidase/6-phospho-beta-glucosidase/beta-galactosidase